jgi:Spy/CpxP family protein refolding chaperone
MNTLNDNNANHTAAPAPRSGRRSLIAIALATAVAAAAGTSFASSGPVLPGHHGHAGHMAMAPADMDAHIDKVVEQCAADASADQKARLAAIAKAAVADLRPAHEQFRQTHARAHELLMAPVIDRAALEQLRAAQMQRIDFTSRRMLAAWEDAADVLTPEQRAKCAEKLRTRLH